MRRGKRERVGEGERGGEEMGVGDGHLVNVSFPQDVYESFNILMRRKPKENNFKVLTLLAPVFSD